MTGTPPPTRAHHTATAALCLALASALGVLAGCGGAGPSSSSSGSSIRAAVLPAAISPSPAPTPAPTPLPPLVTRASTWSADLRSKPVAIPLRFQAPTIGVDIPMEAVGIITRNGVDSMDAPMAGANDPVWRTGFWYRGGVDPGAPGVATIAGHLDDTLGRPAAFWNLRKLHPGDVVQVVDERSGAAVRFRVTEADTYTLAQAGTRAVLDRMFGAAPVDEQPPVFPPDGISRLSLVTCTGAFTRGEYDHRYVVYADRLDGPGSAGSPAPPPPGG